MFLRGFDNGRGLDRSRQFATIQYDTLRAHTHAATIEKAGEHTHSFRYQTFGWPANRVGRRNPFYDPVTTTGVTEPAGAHTHKVTIFSTGETETRPVNTTVVYAIKS